MSSINIYINRAKGGNLAYFKVYSVYHRGSLSDCVALVASYLDEIMADASAKFYNGLGDGVYYVATNIVFVRSL